MLNDFRFGFSYERDSAGTAVQLAVGSSSSEWTFRKDPRRPSKASTFLASLISAVFRSENFRARDSPGRIPSVDTRAAHHRHFGPFERDRLNEYTETNQNGVFTFNNAFTGSRFPISVGQNPHIHSGEWLYPGGSLQAVLAGVQDTFKVSDRLTLSLGFAGSPRSHGRTSSTNRRSSSRTVRPRERSKVYTNAPPGEFFPGDKEFLPPAAAATG